MHVALKAPPPLPTHTHTHNIEFLFVISTDVPYLYYVQDFQDGNDDSAVVRRLVRPP